MFSFLASGDPLASIDSHRPLLQKYGYKLPDATHLSDLIPLVLDDELKRIKEELGARSVFSIYDGASWNGECFTLMFRFISNWKIIQRVVCIDLLDKSLVNQEIATLIIDTIARKYQLAFLDVNGFSYDRAAPNLAAMRTLSTIYVKGENIPCVSHTITHVGEHFWTQNFTPILHYWRGFFSNSPKARTAWQRLTLSSFPSYCDTRWWSEYEEDVCMCINRAHRDDFLISNINGDFSYSAYLKKLYALTVQNDDGGIDWKYAELELTTVVEVARVFVQGTYFLEGYGLLILYTFDFIRHIGKLFQECPLPHHR